MTHNANELAHKAKTHTYLNVIQALLWLIFILPFYLLSGLAALRSQDTIPDWWEAFSLPLWLLVFLVSFLFFTNLIIYVLVSLTVIISGIAAFVWGHKGRLAQICALLMALSVIGLPWLWPYQSALNAAPGVTMEVVTQPSNPLSSFVKMAYMFSEEVPCEYDLLGWNSENQFYYSSQCGAEEQIWLVDPNQPDNPMPTTPLANDLPQKAKKKEQEAFRQEAFEMVRTGGVGSENTEPSTRAIYLREASLRSPDGLWIAIKSQHIYGPQDVVLIKSDAEERRLQEEQNTPGCTEGGIGVHTSEDLRCHLDQVSDEFVRHINDEVSVLFTDPDSIAELIGGAVIYHIPSLSTVTLDFKGHVDLKYTEFKDENALLAFEPILTDAALMAELKQKVQSLWERDTTAEKARDFELELAIVRQYGRDITFIALLTGGEAHQEQLYCAGDHWIFGDKLYEKEIGDCEANEDQDQPDNQPIQRVFLTRHIYERDRQYAASVTVRSEQTSVTSAPLVFFLP